MKIEFTNNEIELKKDEKFIKNEGDPCYLRGHIENKDGEITKYICYLETLDNFPSFPYLTESRGK